VQTRTRNGLFLLAIAAVCSAGLVWVAQRRQAPELRGRALDAIPSGALLVATANLTALRASPVGAPFLREGREIPGLGKVRDVCGFDPMDTLTEVALAIPAAGDAGEFGLSAAGDGDAEALLACAAKVIERRGGRPVITSIGSFRSVRDAAAGVSGGEIAVRKGGLLLLGGGAYLRAMIDAADSRTPSIRSSVAHGRLAEEAGDASVRVTVVLTPDQRKALAEELTNGGEAGSPAASIAAGALGAKLGASVDLHGVIACDGDAAAKSLAVTLKAARDDRASDFGTRLVGFSAVLEQLQIEPKGPMIHARVSVPADQAVTLAERLVTLRSFRHPMPDTPPSPIQAAPSGSPSAAPPSPATSGAAPGPDEVIAPSGGRPKKSEPDGGQANAR
jgi:hypothetical protein